MSRREAPPDAFGRAADEYELGRPDWPARVASGLWREPFAGSQFEEPRHDQQERELLLSRDELIAYVLSISSIAAQSDAQRRELAACLQELVPDREYRRFVRTDAFWTRLA